MELYEIELKDAIARLLALGRKDDFAFSVSFLPPDPDGGGMFTLRYDVTITSTKTDRSLTATGGIGLDWVGAFEEALAEGYFD